jgi:hypothetical protein
MPVRIKGHGAFIKDNQRRKRKRTSIGDSKNTYPKANKQKNNIKNMQDKVNKSCKMNFYST